MNYSIIQTYAFYLKTKKQVKDLTIDRYGRVLRKLREFIKKDLLKAEPNDLESYLASLANNKPSYQLFQLKAIRVFYQWLIKEERIKHDPAIRLQIPQPVKLLPQALSKEELRKLLSVIDPRTPAGKRNRLLFSIMYCTGARISEILNLQVVDINPTEKSLLINNKEDRQRVAYLQQDLLEALLIYIHENRLKKYLFLSKYGNKLCVRQVQLDIKKYAKLAGIPTEKVTPHKLRHSTATHLVQNGYPLLEIGNLLGHSNLATTALYTEVAENQIKKMQDSLLVPLS